MYKLLFKHDVIDDDDHITPDGREAIEQEKIPVPERLEPYKEAVCQLLQAIYTGVEFKAEDERKTVVLSTNKNFDKQEFKALWDKINLKTIYEVQFDTAKLIEQSKVLINAQLVVGDRQYQVKTGEMQESTTAELKQGNAFRDIDIAYFKAQEKLYIHTTYDIVGEIERQTHLTRKTIVAILKAIRPDKFALLRKNPEVFIASCSRLINEVKASLIINNIVYHKTEERYDAHSVFTNDKSALRHSELLGKHIYDFLTTDSDVEKGFATALENSQEVTVYAKLPKSFFISTPVARYSPDWAIVFDKEKVKQVYFVTETKGSDSDQDLREIEKLKIHCAQEHFNAIGGKEVRFERVAGFDSLMKMIELK